ncbi:MAG: hypothetical protein WCH05_06590 [Chlorobiaceae bacterium]
MTFSYEVISLIEDVFASRWEAIAKTITEELGFPVQELISEGDRKMFMLMYVTGYAHAMADRITADRIINAARNN